MARMIGRTDQIITARAEYIPCNSPLPVLYNVQQQLQDHYEQDLVCKVVNESAQYGVREEDGEEKSEHILKAASLSLPFAFKLPHSADHWTARTF